MGTARDIWRSYQSPRGAFRRQAADLREGRLLALLMGAVALIFVAQWPRLVAERAADPSVPLEARIGAALLGLVFLAPLGLYAVAAAAHLLSRLLGGQGSFAAARLALFWSLLAATPLFLLHGLARGLLGATPLVQGIGLVVLAVFLVIWFLSHLEAEWPRATLSPLAS